MASDRKLTEGQMAQLRALNDREPDTGDIPEASSAHWQHAQRGSFFRPRKQAISLRVDMDVLAWLRSYGPGYQSRINEILRRQMDSEQAG